MQLDTFKFRKIMPRPTLKIIYNRLLKPGLQICHSAFNSTVLSGTQRSAKLFGV
jgi:hypothetical protein